MAKLSIITINYNDAVGLEKTIQSVISQSFKDLEFIIIDGGSIDNSVQIIEKYVSAIHFFCSEKDNGIFHAQNKGIAHASAEYCLFLNSGDYLANADVLKQVFEKNITADIIYGDMLIDFGNKHLTHGKMPDIISFHHMYVDTVWHPVSFIKRELFTKIGNYDEQFKIVADYDFFFRAIIINNVTTKHIPLEIAVYNTNGMSSKPELKVQEKKERQTVLYKYLPPLLVDELIKNNRIKPERETTFLKRLALKIKNGR